VTFGGNAGDYGDQRGAQGFVQRALSAAGVPFAAFTVNGDRYNLWKQGYGGTSRAHVRWSLIALARPRNAVIEMAINDITAGDSLAVIQANAIDMIQRLRGLGVEHISMCTCSPATNSSTAAGQSTLADQIVDATVNAKRRDTMPGCVVSAAGWSIAAGTMPQQSRKVARSPRPGSGCLSAARLPPPMASLDRPPRCSWPQPVRA
jgi:hypothetical protein